MKYRGVPQLRTGYIEQRTAAGEFEQLQREIGPLRDILYSRCIDGDDVNYSHKVVKTNPDLSLFMPVALSEPFENVATAVSAVLEASRSSGMTTELTMLANDRRDTEAVLDMDPDLFERQVDTYHQFFSDCRERFETADHSWLRLRTKFELMGPHDRMNEIRALGTFLIGAEGVFRHLPVNHPVGYVDADTLSLGANSLGQVKEQLESGGSPFVHMALSYENQHGNSLDPHILKKMSYAEKVALVHSVTRKLLDEALGPADDHGYVEEPGLFFRIADYFLLGGIGTLHPTKGESATLVEQALQHITLPENVPLVHYLKNAHMAVSDRHSVELAKRNAPWKLAGSEEGADYKEFTFLQYEQALPDERHITLSGVKGMVRRQNNKQIRRTGVGLGRDAHQYVRHVIDLCGFPLNYN